MDQPAAEPAAAEIRASAAFRAAVVPFEAAYSAGIASHEQLVSSGKRTVETGPGAVAPESASAGWNPSGRVVDETWSAPVDSSSEFEARRKMTESGRQRVKKYTLVGSLGQENCRDDLIQQTCSRDLLVVAVP